MSTEEHESLTEQVRRKVKEDGRSISELARLSGVSQPFLSQFANGKRATMPSDLLGGLLGVLGGKVVWKKPRKSAGK